MDPAILAIVIGAASIVLGSIVIHLGWQAIGAWRINRAGPRPLASVRHVLWRDPGQVATRDMNSGPGGTDYEPAPPFRFLEEHLGGSQPCVSVRDRRDRRWRVKWGDEVRSETFAVRLVWACGYFAETTYFVPHGIIEGAKDLQRASACIDDQCRFSEARFELDDPAVKKLFEEHGWAWNDNPFAGSRELQGLKILVMLLSNWDTKDRRDVARGSNTAIFVYPLAGGERSSRRPSTSLGTALSVSKGRSREAAKADEARYLITDWGGSMGRWGGNVVTRGRWDPAGFEDQTPQFVTSSDEGIVKFGYTGQRTEDVAAGITVDDVRWLLRWLGLVTDAQLTTALRASGATDEEAKRFASAIRNRIEQLRQIAMPP